MTLFIDEPFTSHSGLELPFKIDCDALAIDDLKTLARHVAGRLRFRSVDGIPRGGLRFAEALAPYMTADGVNLIVDDVLTTGASMALARLQTRGYPIDRSFGLALFARGPCSPWVTPIFSLHPAWR